jgi:hypothetical protein
MGSVKPLRSPQVFHKILSMQPIKPLYVVFSLLTNRFHGVRLLQLLRSRIRPEGGVTGSGTRELKISIRCDQAAPAQIK